MNVDDFIHLTHDEVQRQAKKLGYSKAVATRAYNIARLAHARDTVNLKDVRGCGEKTAEFVEAL